MFTKSIPLVLTGKTSFVNAFEIKYVETLRTLTVEMIVPVTSNEPGTTVL
jgi:hypothetical protein